MKSLSTSSEKLRKTSSRLARPASCGTSSTAALARERKGAERFAPLRASLHSMSPLCVRARFPNHTSRDQGYISLVA